MQVFDQKNPNENVVLTFNFSLGLPPGVVLTGTPSVTFTTLTGSDPNPSALINGLPAIDATATLVMQPVTGGIDGTDYIAECICPTTAPPWQLAITAILPVRLYPGTTGAP